MKKLITSLLLCILVITHSFAQQKPTQNNKKPVTKPSVVSPKKVTKIPPATQPVSSPVVKEKTSEKPQTPTELSKLGDATKLSNDESDSQLKEIEARNKARIEAQGEEAVFYGMDRNSFTVLPVQVYVPGLGATEEKTGRAIYTPQQLFQTTSLKNHVGDVLISEKYFYNKIGYNAFGMFNELLKDSLNLYALTGLTPKVGSSASVKMPQLSTLIGDYLTKSNVGTDILKIWTNKSILMSRILYTKAEAEKRERVDEKKLEVFGKLLKKNYVLVLALINPGKNVRVNKYGNEIITYFTKVEGFLYQVDTTALNPNNIKNQHPLKFIRQISKPSFDCDPRSEELVEALGGGSSIESFKESVNTLMANTIKEQADYFFKSKAYNCAKNYYEYLLNTADEDKEFIKKRMDECSALQSKTPSKIDTKTCLVTEESAFDDWIYAQSSTNKAMIDLETVMSEDFGTESFIFKTKPYITAEIGKKQGLYTDQRYLVYRKTLLNGKVGRKRIGTLRAIKVADNTDKFKSFKKSSPNTNGLSSSLVKNFQGIIPTNTMSTKKSDSTKAGAVNNTKKTSLPPSSKELRTKALDSLMTKDLNTMSIFKQVDGGKIEEKDLIIQNNDLGLGVQVGTGSRFKVSGLIIGADFRLATLLKMRMPLAGIKIGVNLAMPDQNKLYELYGVPKDKSSVLEIYLARELYMSPKFDLKPLVGVSLFNDKTYLLVGTAAYINLLGKSSNKKVKLAPEVSYALGGSIQYSTNLRIEF